MKNAEDLLESLTGKEFFKGGLERLRPLVEPFRRWISEHKIKIITVGGTNGKGETIYFLEKFFAEDAFQGCQLHFPPCFPYL